MNGRSLSALFVLVILVGFVYTEDSFSCTPGQKFAKDCNLCTCTPDGKNAVCSSDPCDSESESKEESRMMVGLMW
ncbi:protease inhibitors isoform X2 [Leptinotarsa decemlineata]|uniref:protease inhibitors isoform X2 n=1 Tax=Leptinotarsa decemlineata TaxID=7539 RepID=UPI003D3098B6